MTELADKIAADTSKARELYNERAALISVLASLFPAAIAYNDPKAPDVPVIYIDSPCGQLSWHINPAHLRTHFAAVPTVAPHSIRWDGASKDVVLERVALIRQQLAATQR
ncbi:hypothetical protein [Nocardia sp. NPDC060249]|uniref:hypothetical protein n=1 Tax=Nocardia sp. NPDC060249 TaxID=3347082 RepID=UPI0036622C16